MATIPVSYQMLTGGGVLPQALAQPSAQQRIMVATQNTARGLRNVYTDAPAHLQVLYGTNQTPYKSNMACPDGIASVNNECIAPGAPSGVPYRQTVPAYTQTYMNTLFSPLQPEMFPQVSAAAQSLMAERGRCPASAYGAMDSMPLGAGSCSATC